MEAKQTITDEIARPYSVAQVCRILGVGRSTLSAWIGEGAIEAVDVSKTPDIGAPRWRIDADAIERFKAARRNTQRIKPTTPPRRSRRAAVPDYLGVSE